jgi:hypothetical protein
MTVLTAIICYLVFAAIITGAIEVIMRPEPFSTNTRNNAIICAVVGLLFPITLILFILLGNLADQDE